MTADVEAAAPVQCEYRTERGRQCKLLVDPETGVHVNGKPDAHKFAIRKAAGEKPVLPGGVKLKAELVPAAERVRKEVAGRGTEPRDAEQVQVDKDVRAIYEEWVKKGRPGNRDEWPQARYIVPPDAVDAVVFMLRRATQKGAPAEGKNVRYVKARHKSGNTIIAFSCGEKPPPAEESSE